MYVLARAHAASEKELATADIHDGARFVKSQKEQNTYSIFVPTPSTKPEAALIREAWEKLLEDVVRVGAAIKDCGGNDVTSDAMHNARRRGAKTPVVDTSQMKIHTWLQLEKAKRHDMFRELEARCRHMGYM